MDWRVMGPLLCPNRTDIKGGLDKREVFDVKRDDFGDKMILLVIISKDLPAI